MPKLFLIILLSLSLIACTTTKFASPAKISVLQQGKRYFVEGYYKHAMQELLPLACDHNADAEYAVGYMYYYGYGVAQDTDVGYFWIRRSADQQYAPAITALTLITHENQTTHWPVAKINNA